MIVPLNCPFCNGELKVNHDNETAACDYCGRTFIVKDAIVRNYINSVTNIVAEHVHVSSKSDFEVRGGKLEKYSGEGIEIMIPDNVIEIGDRVFEGLPIKSVVVPNSVKKLGSGVFLDCTSLENVTLSKKITEISNACFAGCASLETISIPNSVRAIHSTAFSNCISLRNVELPEGIADIGSFAFEHCIKLEKIKIPDTVLKIGKGSFCGCTSLTSVKIGTRVNTLGYNDGVVSTINDGVFHNCKSLASVIIPDSVTSIGALTFSGCSSLKRINIPKNVQYIGSGAFQDCQGVDFTIEIPYYDPHVNQGFEYVREIREKEFQIKKWKENGLCQYCGGKISLWSNECKKCGRKKDYLI